jgi:hypothetical protein
MEPIDFPKMSVTDYEFTLCNIPEERAFEVLGYLLVMYLNLAKANI